MMPVVALAFAASLAFANKANVQSAGWIDSDNGPQQLRSNPCVSEQNKPCEVILSSEPGTVYQVFTNSNLDVKKMNGRGIPYTIDE